MNIFLIILLALCWYLIGLAGFAYWWTKDWDLTNRESALMSVAGFMGPLAWVFGWLIHGGKSSKEPTVILKKRGRHESK